MTALLIIDRKKIVNKLTACHAHVDANTSSVPAPIEKKEEEESLSHLKIRHS